MAQRDIWLVTDGQCWRVRGLLGGDGGQEVSYDFPDEASARLIVDRIMKTSAGTWRYLTEAVRQESTRGGLGSQRAVWAWRADGLGIGAELRRAA